MAEYTEGMDGRMAEWGGKMSGWMNRWKSQWMKGLVDWWAGEQMDGWMVRWMSGWMSGPESRWTDGGINKMDEKMYG